MGHLQSYHQREQDPGGLPRHPGGHPSLLQVSEHDKLFIKLMLYLFSLLNCKDTQVIQVVLDGLNNLLKVAGADVSDLNNNPRNINVCNYPFLIIYL